MQVMMEEMGEDRPADEEYAYAVQKATKELIREYALLVHGVNGG